MIPRWLLIVMAMVTLAVFVFDYGAQYFIPGHVSSPALTTLAGSVCGAAFLLAKSDKGDSEHRK